MKYRGKYSLKENLFKGRGMRLLKEESAEEVEAATGVEIEDDGNVVTIVDPETGESISATMDGEIVEGNVKRRPRLQEGLKGVGTHTYGPFTFVVQANGTTEIKLTLTGALLMTKSSEGSAHGYMRQASGSYYEKRVVKSIPGASQSGGPGNPDITGIKMTGGGTHNAECGGLNKVSQMGGVDTNGKTVATSDKRHEARRKALGHGAKATSGGVDAKPGTKFNAAQAFAYWTACANLTGSHQEELLIGSDGTDMYVFALKDGLGNLVSHPNINIPVLTAADVRGSTLQPAGDEKPVRRTAPNYNTVKWSNAAKIPH